ncbi:hypothetical protein ACVJMZ_000146, partial [Sinorhizobium medicae]
NVSDALTTEIEDGSEAQKAPVWGLFCLAFVFDLVAGAGFEPAAFRL